MLNRTVKEVRSEVLSLFIPVYPDKSGTSRELVGSRTKGRQQRWRDGALGISRKGIKVVCAAKLPLPQNSGEGVRGRGPFERLRIILGNYFVMYFSSSKNTSPLAYIKEISYLCRRIPFESISKTTRKRLENDTIQ